MGNISELPDLACDATKSAGGGVSETQPHSPPETGLARSAGLIPSHRQILLMSMILLRMTKGIAVSVRVHIREAPVGARAKSHQTQLVVSIII